MRGERGIPEMVGQAMALGVLLGLPVLASASGPPEGSSRLPADVRAKATVVVLGTFSTGRGPCEFLPDRTRRWALLRGFTIEEVYRGDVATGYIGVAGAAGIGPKGEPIVLVEGRKYLLLLRPSDESIKMLAERERRVSHRDALQEDEVVAILEP